MQKKRYTAPTLTALGGATEKTRGRFGNRIELINWYLFLR
jgi:hypothetical protein